MYQSNSNELQVFLLPTATLPRQWVDIPLLVAQAQLLADMHNPLAHCGWGKLLSALVGSTVG